jgi:hypothetical protein
MRPRGEHGRRLRAAALAAWVAGATLLPACDGGNVSVGVGVAVPGPWGGAVAVSGAVPLGPYTGGRMAPMW